MLDILLVHAGSALEQTRVQVEDVTRVGFAARRAAQQQRHLTIGPGLLGQVIIDDQGILATVAEVLTHRAAGVGSQVLHGGGLGSGRGHDDGVFHRAELFQLAHHVGDGGGLLADRHVDTDQVLALLVDDGVDGHGRLAGLAVADDQLTLAPADGHHGIDGLQTGLHRLGHRLTGDDARRHLLDHVGFLGVDRTLAVDGLTQRVHHTTDQLGTDGHFQNAAGGLDDVAFGNALVFTEDHRADRVALEVQRQAVDVARELDHLALHHVGETVDPADAVGDRDDRALVPGVSRDLKVLDLAFEQFADFSGIELHEGNSLFRQGRGQLGQLATHGCVNDFVAYLDGDAANQFGVYGGGGLDTLAEALLERVDDGGLLGVGQLEG